MSHWAPKPLRPTINQGLFQFDHPDVRITGGSAIERQRHMDGTPITVGNKTKLEPYEPKLTLSKGTKVEAPDSEPAAEVDPQERLKKSREVLKGYMKDHGIDEPMC